MVVGELLQVLLLLLSVHAMEGRSGKLSKKPKKIECPAKSHNKNAMLSV